MSKKSRRIPDPSGVQDDTETGVGQGSNTEARTESNSNTNHGASANTKSNSKQNGGTRTKARTSFNANANASGSSKNSDSTSTTQSIDFLASDRDALIVWKMLTAPEKLIVLEVSAEEVWKEVESMLGVENRGIEEMARNGAKALLDDGKRITELRMKFIYACEMHEEKIGLDDEMILVGPVVKVMEKHLRLFYALKKAQYKTVLLFGFFALFLSQWSWLVALIMIIAVTLFFILEIFNFPSYRYYFLIPFADNDPDRFESFFESFFVSIFIIQLAPTFQGWYLPAVFFSSVPLFFIIFERSFAAGAEIKSFAYFRKLLCFFLDLVLMYYLWPSWSNLLSGMYLFFPTLSKWIFTGMMLCFAAMGIGISILQGFMVPSNLRDMPLIIWIGVWIVASLHVLYLLIWNFIWSWERFLWLTILVIMLVPAPAIKLLSALAIIIQPFRSAFFDPVQLVPLSISCCLLAGALLQAFCEYCYTLLNEWRHAPNRDDNSRERN